MTSKNRIDRLERKLGVHSGVDGIPIVTVVIERREQIEILEGLVDSEGIVSGRCPVDLSVALTFEQAIQGIEAAKF